MQAVSNLGEIASENIGYERKSAIIALKVHYCTLSILVLTELNLY